MRTGISAHFAVAAVGNQPRADDRIGQDAQRIVQPAYFGTAKSQILYGALHPGAGDPVTNGKRFFYQQYQPGKQVGSTVLCGKRNGQPAKPQPGNQPADLKPQFSHGGQCGKHHNQHFQRAAQHTAHRLGAA
ncbi:hypothetical protein SDC9_179971 [bioreactor metagenome]|uniref:Uncharacterized protein n=1 Tax=bioreactor metagenome TaxID=1076179 RepID=A0A645H2D9_9ZZZZ